MMGGWRQSPGWPAHARAIFMRALSCPPVTMRSSRSGSRSALRASTAPAAHGLARWLVLLLLMLDVFSAPWHPHHHDSGVDGTHFAVVHAHGLQSELLAEAHAEAPDHRSTWTHATTVLRTETGPSLPMPADNDDGPVSLWPVARLTPAIDEPTPLPVSRHQKPPSTAYRSLRPSPQAPPWRA